MEIQQLSFNDSLSAETPLRLVCGSLELLHQLFKAKIRSKCVKLHIEWYPEADSILILDRPLQLLQGVFLISQSSSS